MSTFTHPVSGYIHTQFTVVLSAHHTHGSAVQPTADELNHAYHKSLGLNIMESIGTNNMLWGECQGVYDGITEQSYIVHCHSIVDVMHMYELGKQYNQECILVVDHRGECAALMYMDGQVSRIGKNLVQACDTVKEDYTQIGSKRYTVV